jgi:mono/diheme cytochrome c family protein
MPAIRPSLKVLACALGFFAADSFSGAVAENAPGESVYTQHCLFCHGVDRKGIDGLGVDLSASEFVRSKSPDDLVAFLKAGRTPDDPATVTGRPMPTFDWLSDSDLRAVAEYVGGGR